MISNGRFLSPLENDKRSSVLEYCSAERTKKLKGVQIREKIKFFRIGSFPIDKIVTILQEVFRTVGLLHYNSVVLFDLDKSMM